MCDDQAKIFKQHKIGATYIPLEDAFDLQIQMKKEGSRSILHVDKESGRIHCTNFVAKWPRRIIRVMPAGSEYGSRCCGCPGFQKKEVIFWFVINVAHVVPEVWRSMDSTVARTTDWEGWILTFIVTKVVPHKAMKTNRNNPFCVNNLAAWKISQMLMSECLLASEEPLAALLTSMKRLFYRNRHVKVVNSSGHIDNDFEVIIFVFDEEYATEHLQVSDSLFEHFELRVIGCGSDAGEGKIFARHGKNFRFQEITQKEQAGGCNCSESNTDIISHLEATWRYMVFV